MGKAILTGATSIHDLTDDLLELVLLSLDSPISLVRAAALCKHWRRLVAGTDNGAAFLHRFRSLHPPQAIGTFYNINRDTPGSYDQCHEWPEVDPVFVPFSRSASTSDEPSVLQLSLDFVPPADGGPRELVDGRGSLLLLLREKARPDRRGCLCCLHSADYMIPDLVVCEPLTRQYRAITPPHDTVCILGAFLLDGGGATVGITNFRVLLVLYEHEEENGPMSGHNGHGYPSASVFNGAGWNHGYIDYDDGVYLPDLHEIHFAGRAGGRIYWVCDDKQVMVLDEGTLQFSTMAPSEYGRNWQEFARDNFRVVETLELKHEYGTEQYTGPAFTYTLPWSPVICACVETEKEEERNGKSFVDDYDLVYDIHVLFSMEDSGFEQSSEIMDIVYTEDHCIRTNSKYACRMLWVVVAIFVYYLLLLLQQII